ncbi:BAH_G0037390.mRNA.1.CDS.1 [Saccharomyces cerevisiae]|nr:BAH_G0037390.mRNA.1.CDS.1 [Saccharomyces cerevisiae]CAI7225006.1 BAH_G0037390.mRNA.1.CDS.1 [Saccharomyces cerevisiae]
MLQIPFDVFGLDCFNVDAFLFIVGSVFVYECVYANKGFLYSYVITNSLLSSFFHQYRPLYL